MRRGTVRARGGRSRLARVTDAVVVGAGPAGLSAALQLVRQGLEVVVLERDRPGGQLSAANLVENYPGISPLPGAALARRIAAQARRAGVRVVREEALRIARGPPLTVVTSAGRRRARAVVVATGAEPVGVRGIDTVYGIRDARRYRGREVAIVGGGDAALDAALRLRGAGARVTVLCRGALSALPLLVRRCRRAGVRVLTGCPVLSLTRGAGRPGGSRAGGAGRGWRVETAVGSMEFDGVLSALGKVPRAGILPLPIERLRPHPLTGRTVVPGLYIIGDLAAGRHRQLAVAAGMGVAAAMDAADFIEGRRGSRGAGW